MRLIFLGVVAFFFLFVWFQSGHRSDWPSSFECLSLHNSTPSTESKYFASVGEPTPNVVTSNPKSTTANARAQSAVVDASEQLMAGADFEKVRSMELEFRAESRDRYWANSAQSRLSAILDTLPGRQNFDVAVDCHQKSCRTSATIAPEIMDLVSKDTDWETTLNAAIKEPPLSELFETQSSTIQVDSTSGLLTIVSIFRRREEAYPP